MTLFKKIFAAWLVLPLSVSYAEGESPQAFTLDGRLYNSSSPTNPLLDSDVQFRLQILDETRSCVLYEEIQHVDTLSNDGYFTIKVGSSSGASRRGTNDSGNGMATIYQNRVSVAGKDANGASCLAPAGAAQSRYFRMEVTPSSTRVASVLTPDMSLESVPNALVAETVQGLKPSDLLQTGNDHLNQVNLQDIFSNTKFPKLSSLLDGTSTEYVQNSGSGIQVPSVAGDPVAPSTGQFWYDTTTNSLKYFDGTAVTSIGAAGSGVKSVSSGTGLIGGPITDTGTLSVNVGTQEGQIVQVQTDSKLPVLDGSNLSHVHAETVSGSGITSGQIGGTTSINTSGSIQTTSNITALGDGSTTGVITGSAFRASNITTENLQIYNPSHSNYVQLSSPADLSSNFTLTLPSILGAPSQVLSTDGSGHLTWVTPNAGSVTRVTAGEGLVGGDITSTGTIALGESGVTPSTYGSSTQVPQVNVDKFGRVTAVTNVTISGVAPAGSAAGDLGGAYPNPIVEKIQGTPVSATAAVASQALMFDGASWSPQYLFGSDMRSSIGPMYGRFIPSSCAQGSTLNYNSVTDTLECQGLAIEDSQITYAAQIQNRVFASPENGAGAPSYRSLVQNDLPDLDWSKITTGKPTTLAGYGISDSIVKNAGGAASLQAGLNAAKPTTDWEAGRLYVATDTRELYRDNGSQWVMIGSSGTQGGTINNVIAGTGLTGGGTSGSVTVNLANTAVTPGDYGLPAKIPKFTVDAQGRITAVSEEAVAITEANITYSDKDAFKVFAGPSSAGTGTPTFRILTSNDIPELDWSKITTGKPTTLSGYGITDAQSSTLASGNILIGNASNIATAVTASGDATIDTTGAVTITKVGGSTAAQVRSAELLANAATSVNTASALVARDASGNFAAGNVTADQSLLKSSGGANTIGLSAPATLASSYSLTLPTAAGTSGQFLSTSGSGQLTWSTPLSAVSNTASLASGKVWLGDGSGKAQEVTVSGDVSMTNAGVSTVSRLQGTAVSAVTPTSGQIMKFNGTSWSGVSAAISDITNLQTLLDAKVPFTAHQICGVDQVEIFNSVSNTFTCSSIAITDSQVTFASQAKNMVFASPATAAGAPTYRALATSDLPSSVVLDGGNPATAGMIVGTSTAQSIGIKTNDVTRLTVLSNGNIGVNTASPVSSFNVAGAIVSVPTTPASSTVDAAATNTAVLSSVGGSTITMNNMVHGGTYTVVVKDTTARTYTFGNCASSKYKPANSITSSGTWSVYSILALSNGSTFDCVISWGTGYQ